MDWDDIRTFLAVARRGQLLGAARALNVNHATVARRVGALEASLGTKLFRRKTSGTELTPEGETFLAFAEAMESASIRGAQAVGSNEQIVEGTVRVGAPDGFGVGFLAPLLGELSDRYPALRIELVPVPRSFSLSKREADIAVTLERPTEGRLVARKLTDYELGLYASRHYLETHGAPANLTELGRHRLVGYVEDLIFSASLDYTAEFLRDWRSRIAVSSAMGQIQAVKSGAGIGILHAFMASTEEQLVPVLPAHVLQRSYWMVVHQDLRGLKRVEVIADFLSAAAAKARRRFLPSAFTGR